LGGFFNGEVLTNPIDGSPAVHFYDSLAQNLRLSKNKLSENKDTSAKKQCTKQAASAALTPAKSGHFSHLPSLDRLDAN
jgi:hypothetical protein